MMPIFRRVRAISVATFLFAAGTSLTLQQAAYAAPPTVAQPGPANAVTGAIDAVTVYRGQALVTRAVDIADGPGLREIVITNLPEAIIPGSLYAESAEGVEVRSVSYRIRPVGEDARDSVRNAEKGLQDARDALDAAKTHQAYLEWQRQYLDKLEGFVAPSAQVELKGGVLNADTLTKLTDMIVSRRKSLSDEAQKLNIDTRTLSAAVSLKERELAVLTASTSRTAREAVVFTNITKAGARLRLSYLVNNANWTPSYNLRIADAKVNKATLEYQASVEQMSGEDWGSVQLTLSTATPALVANGPSLQPLTVALVAPQAANQVALALLKEKGYDEAKKDLMVQQRQVERSRNINAPGDNNNLQQAIREQGGSMQEASQPAVLSLDSGLNEVADKSQLLDLISSGKVERKGKSDTVVVRQGDEGVSVTYHIASRTSMPSRADHQLIQITQLELPAEVARVATPTLTQYVYNEARLTNTSDLVLLAGPTASYMGGEFVGSAGLPTVTAGESFRAGFGIDSSLRARKELVERNETTQGGNRVIEFTYKLTIENFGKSVASIRLLDRLPSPKGTEIRLTLLEQSPAISDDKDYQDTDRKKNLLRWDLVTPPGATGTSAMAVEYKFRLEFDKQMSLTER